MQYTSAEYERLLQRVRDGSQEAAWELVERYSPYILRAVRRRLPVALRSKFDSQDYVQATWASVFQHASKLSRFDQPEQFIAFIAKVASNKVKVEVRRRTRLQKHNVQRERPLDDSTSGLREKIATPEPSPSQLAMARETWFELLKDQPSHYKEIVELKYRGLSMREIATKLGLHEGTVQRALRKLLRSQRL